MGDQISLGVLAIVLGAIAGVILFVPFVALSYRRRGRLTAGRAMLWAAALVYFLAIWTYTFLPVPATSDYRCAGVNLDVWAFVGDLRQVWAQPANPFLDPITLQLALNVLLFLPLGFFLRVFFGRGIVVALAVGLGLSLVIETTQLTGVWGLFPCAYRVFDVDDLLTNTTGALLGSLAAFLVPRRHRTGQAPADADIPRPITRRRRALGAFCDLLSAGLVLVGATIVVQLALQLLGRDDLVDDGTVAAYAATGTVLVVWLVMVLVTGRTIGDNTVDLHYTGGPLPVPLARLLRYAGGVGGLYLFDLLPDPWSGFGALFLIAAVVLVVTTKDGRGLPGLLSGQRVEDTRRPPASVTAPDSPPATDSTS